MNYRLLCAALCSSLYSSSLFCADTSGKELDTKSLYSVRRVDNAASVELMQGWLEKIKKEGKRAKELEAFRFIISSKATEPNPSSELYAFWFILKNKKTFVAYACTHHPQLKRPISVISYKEGVVIPPAVTELLKKRAEKLWEKYKNPNIEPSEG